MHIYEQFDYHDLTPEVLINFLSAIPRDQLLGIAVTDNRGDISIYDRPNTERGSRSRSIQKNQSPRLSESALHIVEEVISSAMASDDGRFVIIKSDLIYRLRDAIDASNQ